MIVKILDFIFRSLTIISLNTKRIIAREIRFSEYNFSFSLSEQLKEGKSLVNVLRIDSL